MPPDCHNPERCRHDARPARIESLVEAVVVHPLIPPAALKVARCVAVIKCKGVIVLAVVAVPHRPVQ